MQLIIPFVNNWDDGYGGYAAYNAPNNTQTNWYTDALHQSMYQSYVSLLVNRYKSSPAIFAWELGWFEFRPLLRL